MKVAVLMGSASDKAKMAPALEMLEQLGVEAVEEVMSAHRTPDVVASFAAEAKDMGFGVIICGAGMAAHLAGAVAARTTLPVIGVPTVGERPGRAWMLSMPLCRCRGASRWRRWPSTGRLTRPCWRRRSSAFKTRAWRNGWRPIAPASPAAEPLLAR